MLESLGRKACRRDVDGATSRRRLMSPDAHVDLPSTGRRDGYSSSLLRTVVASLPFKDHSQAAIKRALHLARAEVPMLLAVGHDNAQFIRLPLDGLFLSVHGTEHEHGSSRWVAFERLRHPLQDLREQFPSQWRSRVGRTGVAQLGATRRPDPMPIVLDGPMSPEFPSAVLYP